MSRNFKLWEVSFISPQSERSELKGVTYFWECAIGYRYKVWLVTVMVMPVVAVML